MRKDWPVKAHLPKLLTPGDSNIPGPLPHEIDLLLVLRHLPTAKGETQDRVTGAGAQQREAGG